MKKTIFLITAFSLLGSAACAAGTKASAAAKQKAPQFRTYSMDNGYFSCAVPSAWRLERDKSKDEEYKIYEIELIAPKPGKVPAAVFVSYYAGNNEDFGGHKDFMDRNSKNALGETKSARENYEPVKELKLAGRRAFELSREKLEYLHPESKSDESVQLKEKLYVLPAKEGFYVLHFTAEKAAFLESLKTFEKIAGSFKGKF